MSTLADPTVFEPQWDDPDDASSPWFQDVMHNPAPITPLNATLFQPAFVAGTRLAFERLSMPVRGIRSTVHHGYVYLGAVSEPETPESLDARMAEMQRLTMVLGPTVLADWRTKYEPRVLAIAEEVLGFDFAGASLRDVAVHLTQTPDWFTEVWDIHFMVNVPPMNAVFGLEEFLGGVLGPEVLPEVRQLLQGFDNKSVEMGHSLWTLSRWIRGIDGLADAVAAAGAQGAAVDLGGHAAHDEFATRWQAFLDTYGWRSDVFMEIGHSSWREDASTPLNQLQRFLAMEDIDDPYVAHARQAADREALEAAVEARLPADLHGIYRALLGSAQQYIPIAEDHNFTIDQKFTMVVRDAFLHLGRKLASVAALAEAEDVFYLEWREVEGLAAGTEPAGLGVAVAERRTRRVMQRAMDAPPLLGAPPPADAPLDPMAAKFFGLGVIQGDDPTIITGHGVSAGTVEGTARVVNSLDDAHRLEPDEILVCPMTMPAWTPLFAIAAAVVCDSGGPLSHCAIVAREYMIPCVAGTVVGTRAIRDGARIHVNGTTGTVRMLD